MSELLCEALDRLQAAYRDGHRLALFFDYDGTLAPIVARPELAWLTPRVRGLLRRLAALPRVAVGVLSGRMLDDVRDMVGLAGLYYGGTTGLELDLRGRVQAHPLAEPGRPLVRSLAARLRAVVADYAGAWVEEKPFGLTLHYREVARAVAGELRARAQQVLQRNADRLRVLNGPLALEMVLAVGGGKGAALRRFMADTGSHHSRSGLVLYAGDGANDADALETALELGGVAIGVGPHAPAVAPLNLPDPAALHAMLARFLRTISPHNAG